MSISRNPEFFVSGLMKPGKKKPLGIVDLSFFDQIASKYRHAASFIKTQLYYLYFLKQVKSLKKNLPINFFMHSHFNIYQSRLLQNWTPQPVFYFQNIAIRAIKKLLKINHESAKAQKHEIRPGNQVANILFRDTSFFTDLRLNPIFNRADQVSPATHFTHNTWSALLDSYHFQFFPLFMQNFVNPEVRDGQKRLKFYEKQSRQRSRRHGGMELATLPYTGVSSRIKSFAKPGSIKLSPAVPPFLQMEVSNKSNVEQRISAFPEKDLSYYLSTSRTHHNTTIANFFRHTDVHNRTKPFFKPYLTQFPVTIMSQRREIFSLYDNVTNEKQSNISKETIARPISLIPFDKPAALIADLPPLPAVFSKLTVMRENPLLEAKDTDSHPKKRAGKQPIESDTAHLNNIMKSINFDKKSINRMRYIPFSDYNFTYMMKQRYMLRKSDSVKTINNPTNFPDMTYFSLNRSPHSTDMAERSEERKRTEFLKVDSLDKTDHTKLLSVPGPDLYGLADKVYGLIVERIKRERELRGR